MFYVLHFSFLIFICPDGFPTQINDLWYNTIKAESERETTNAYCIIDPNDLVRIEFSETYISDSNKKLYLI